MKTIVVADALMGVDNVLGVAGAAHGALDLVVIGLLVSVPIVVFGSSVVLRLVERFPAIIQLGAAVLALTATKMVLSEQALAGVFGARDAPVDTLQTALRWSVQVGAVAAVLAAGWWHNRSAARAAAVNDIDAG
jgi:predicted tellurium resistance membrane protein TerC